MTTWIVGYAFCIVIVQVLDAIAIISRHYNHRYYTCFIKYLLPGWLTQKYIYIKDNCLPYYLLYYVSFCIRCNISFHFVIQAIREKCVLPYFWLGERRAVCDMDAKSKFGQGKAGENKKVRLKCIYYSFILDC